MASKSTIKKLDKEVEIFIDNIYRAITMLTERLSRIEKVVFKEEIKD